MLEKLRKIFDYYKKEYKLKTKLIFENHEKCAFNTEQNYIDYDIDFVTKEIDNHIIGKLNQKKKLVFCLLHELGHSIDWQYNKELCKKEMEKMSLFLYMFDYDYCISRPFEKRANGFAQKEIKKWTNI